MRPDPQTDAPVIGDEDLPTLFRAADRASMEAQRRFVVRTGVYLALLLVAAVGSVVDLHVRNGTVNVGGALSASGFLCALAVGWSATTRRLEGQWHEFRACAESVKTLAWRYAVTAHPFPSDLNGDQADALFGSRLLDILNGLRGTDLPPVHGSPQITRTMRAVRALPLADRIDCYVNGRIDQQAAWYADKAQVNRSRVGQWNTAATTAAFLGSAAGLARAFTFVDVDWLGILAALAASFTAWTQMRQHQALASNYSIAAQELALIRDRLTPEMDELAWARFTSDAELAISREHTMWTARRMVH